MVRGTTPELTFKLPFECNNMSICNIAFSQKLTPLSKDSSVIFEKKLSDCTVDGKNLKVILSEENTLALNSKMPLEMQIRCQCGNKKLASKVIKTDVGRILKDGVLSG